MSLPDNDIPAQFRQPGKTPQQLRWLSRVDWDDINRRLNRPRTQQGGTR